MQNVLLREYVREVLNEGYEDVIEVIIRIRARIQGAGSRTLRDILTDIRGLINVITVEQIGKISPRDKDGKAFVVLNVKFEDDEHYNVPDMLQDVRDIPDVDFVKFIRIDDPRKRE